MTPQCALVELARLTVERLLSRWMRGGLRSPSSCVGTIARPYGLIRYVLNTRTRARGVKTRIVHDLSLYLSLSLLPRCPTRREECRRRSPIVQTETALHVRYTRSACTTWTRYLTGRQAGRQGCRQGVSLIPCYLLIHDRVGSYHERKCPSYVSEIPHKQIHRLYLTGRVSYTHTTPRKIRYIHTV
jgi:hypothetical protein